MKQLRATPPPTQTANNHTNWSKQISQVSLLYLCYFLQRELKGFHVCYYNKVVLTESSSEGLGLGFCPSLLEDTFGKEISGLQILSQMLSCIPVTSAPQESEAHKFKASQGYRVSSVPPWVALCTPIHIDQQVFTCIASLWLWAQCPEKPIHLPEAIVLSRLKPTFLFY